MRKVFSSKHLILFFALIFPCIFFSQENDDSWSRDIEPPPAPIDDSLWVLVVLAVLFVAYYIYRIRIKIDTK